jgi:hypothetical protein
VELNRRAALGLGLCAVGLGGLVGLVGCSRSSAPTDAGTGSDGAVALAHVDAGGDGGLAVATPASHGAHQVSACRAVSVNGKVGWGDGSAVLADNASLPDQMFLALDKGASFTARDPRTMRETRFSGPGLVRACVDGQERTDLVSGTFISTPGSGEAPGHEEWVVTSLAVIRYSAAAVEVRAKGIALLAEIRPRGGEAFVWVSPYAVMTPTVHDAGAGAGGPNGSWIPLSTSTGEPYRIVPRVVDAPGATSDGEIGVTDPFVTDCLERANLAATDADKLHDVRSGSRPEPGASVVALKDARAACAIAELRASYGFASAGDGGVAARAHTANTAIDYAMRRAKLGTVR